VLGLAEHEWIVVGVVLGILIGIPLGALLYRLLSAQGPGTVVFDRDDRGRIVAIHYVPGARAV